MPDFIYDIESYPNVFTAVFVLPDARDPARVGTEWIFEVSDRVDQSRHLWEFLHAAVFAPTVRMVGYNNVGYDYPVLHHLYLYGANGFTAADAYQKSMSIINTPWDDRFRNTVSARDVRIYQADLYRIWHFDNANRATSLKQIEIALRMPHVADLPFPPGTHLTADQIPALIAYNRHDVRATQAFWCESRTALQFRAEMSEALDEDVTNASDSSIGSKVFISRLEAAQPGACGKPGQWRQTPRASIRLADCILPIVRFRHPEFNRVLDYLRGRTITRTKGVFDDLTATCYGLTFAFGTGGIHGAVENRTWRSSPPPRVLVCGGRDFADAAVLDWVLSDVLRKRGIAAVIHGAARGADTLAAQFALRHDLPCEPYPADWNTHGLAAGPIRNEQMLSEARPDMVIAFPGGRGTNHMMDIARRDDVDVIDVASGYAMVRAGRTIQGRDVSSYYPNLAIVPRVYPAHLSEAFCDIYKQLYDQRQTIPKSDPRNKALKLALNGTYGNSNSQYSPFYDPQYTMTITINGQLLLCMLVEALAQIPTLELIQVNTDGVEYAVDRDRAAECDRVSAEWERLTGLVLECEDYDSFFQRDVNSYLCIDTGGGVKCKGAFEYQHGLEGGKPGARDGWHKNQSHKIVPMAAEAFLVRGVPVAETVATCRDPYLFMHTLKAQRRDRVMLGGALEDYEDTASPPDAKGRHPKRKRHVGGVQQQRTGRFYIARDGQPLWKIMAPLARLPHHERPQAIEKGHGVAMCNDLHDFDWSRLDMDYYVRAAQELVDSTGNNG